jgi:DNA-binding transcriptional LysR family regulator
VTTPPIFGVVDFMDSWVRVVRDVAQAPRKVASALATLGQSLQGRVRLSVPSGCGQLVMSDWLIAFKRLYPGIVLDVMFENSVEDLMRFELQRAVLRASMRIPRRSSSGLPMHRPQVRIRYPE